MGDMLGSLKGALVNFVVRRVKKLVPPIRCRPGAVVQRRAAQGRKLPFTRAAVGPDDIAFLQYTGGTTGVSKGAMLLHRNMVANMLQVRSLASADRRRSRRRRAADHRLRAAALSHLRADRAACCSACAWARCYLLIPNPRDMPA